MEYAGIASDIIPASFSLILIDTFFAEVFRITKTLFDCGVRKPMNSNELPLEEVTEIL